MDFRLNQEQRQIRDTVAEFVDEEVVPRASEIDATDEFPADLVEQIGDLGIMGAPFPEEYGGAGLDYHSYAIALEEISRGSGGLGTVVAAHVSLAGNMLYEFGNEARRRSTSSHSPGATTSEPSRSPSRARAATCPRWRPRRPTTTPPGSTSSRAASSGSPTA